MSEDAAIDDPVPALLQLLAEHGELSLPRAARRLGLRASVLRRLLTALGDDPRCDGLGLVAVREADGRTLLRLTARGQALCAGAR